MGNNLIESSPTPGSYGARPYTSSEIDSLENADRVWATVTACAVEVSEAKTRIDDSKERLLQEVAVLVYTCKDALESSLISYSTALDDAVEKLVNSVEQLNVNEA